jgi:hypothetical protein
MINKTDLVFGLLLLLSAPMFIAVQTRGMPAETYWYKDTPFHQRYHEQDSFMDTKVLAWQGNPPAILACVEYCERKGYYSTASAWRQRARDLGSDCSNPKSHKP